MKFKYLLTVLIYLAIIDVSQASSETEKFDIVKKMTSVVKVTTADHSKFEQLDQEFDFAPDVTAACLECHTEAAKHVQESFHWKWAAKVDGKMVGKGQNGFNNYCVSARGNASCTQCHAGYGWRNDDFDFEEEENVDCLVCHDTTATYKKSATTSGHPYYEDTKVNGKIIKAIDLRHVAKNVGAPQRENCLACHANGGGGNGVKHGDTDTSLIDPVHELDVHMSSEKLNFTCQTCHSTSGHKISGRYNDTKSFLDHEKNMGRDAREGKNVSCESCHGNVPHEDRQTNNHTTKVACTSCHIPKMARGGIPTKLAWDWSSATQMKNGKPFNEEAHFVTPDKLPEAIEKWYENDHDYTDFIAKGEHEGVEAHKYMSKKGHFIYGENVVPEYRWYKGELGVMTYDSVIDPTKAPVNLNPPTGDYKDPDARIWPFKIHRGKQPYNTDTNKIMPLHSFGKKGSGALWSDFDWAVALENGAKLNEIEDYKGNFDFVRTDMYWPIKHMVAPSEEALECTECHARNGRLAKVDDFYLVGRDSYPFVDLFGLLALCGGLLLVVGHGLARYISAKLRQKSNVSNNVNNKVEK
ncbi:MAG: multiheme c-type cytochrome [Colwellia sp.]